MINQLSSDRQLSNDQPVAALTGYNANRLPIRLPCDGYAAQLRHRGPANPDGSEGTLVCERTDGSVPRALASASSTR